MGSLNFSNFYGSDSNIPLVRDARDQSQSGSLFSFFLSITIVLYPFHSWSMLTLKRIIVTKAASIVIQMHKRQRFFTCMDADRSSYGRKIMTVLLFRLPIHYI